jgi:hypothetical protein
MLLVLGGGCHLFFKKLDEHLLLLVVRVHVRPPRQMDEHLPGVSTRRDGRSCPTSEYRQTARRRRNIGWWEEGRRSAGNRPADWRGVVAAATEQRGEGRGDLRRESGIRVFSRRQSGPIYYFLFFRDPLCKASRFPSFSRVFWLVQRVVSCNLLLV